MANRYWVGGTGGWDTTSTTNWSALSGGASGASVPTLNDDVFFDTLSNLTAYTVTISSSAVAVSCRSLSISGPASGNVTVASNGVFNVCGSLTIAATGVTWTAGNTMQFAATTTGWTITTNGVTVNPVSFTGVGGGWTLGSAFTTSSNFTFSAGTFSTANFNLTVTNNFTSTGASARTLNLGSSAISCGLWSCLNATNLTLNAGTSTITVTGSAFNGGGLTYYNYFKTQNGFNIGDGGNTFNAVTMNTATSGGTFVCSFAGNQTIGTLTINGGASAGQRASIQTPATLVGTQITLTVASFVTNGFVDFRDINFQGAASPLTVATGGDCGNNTNITLATPKTVYWNLAAGGTWNANTAWATTSGGSPSLANYPLPQDTAIIEDTGLNSGASVSFVNNPSLGTVNISSRTLPMTLAFGTVAPVIYGDLTLSSAVTTTATTGSLTFSGFNKTQTITSAGTTAAFGITILGRLTTVALSGALTSTATTTLTQGTLNLANNNLTCGAFNSNNSNTRAITFGTGQIYATATGIAIDFSVMTGFTYTGSGVFNYSTNFSSGGRTCIFGTATGTEANALSINFTAGTDVCAVYGLAIKNINFTGYAGTWVPTGAQVIYGDLTLATTMTVTSSGNLTFAATSGIQNFTSNGKALVSLVFKTGAGTLRLVDAATLGTTFTHTVGTFDLNAQTATMGLFSSTGTGVRSIAFNGGIMVVSGASFTASGSNFTTTGSGAICMTNSLTKTFAGGGFSYPTLCQDGPGPGPLLITGANTFNDITNGILYPGIQATIIFPSLTTTNVSNFTAGGTALANLIAIESNVAGVTATVNYVGTGTVFATYITIQDLTVTPSPRWQANTATTTIVSNVSGWIVTNFYYWVGGTGNWDATNTRWAATSGGAGGAGVPTLADNVFFDSASNATAYVCTLTTTPVCASVNIAGPATGNVTIAGSAGWSVYGSFTLAATGITWTNTSVITFAATTTGWTVTTNGVSLVGIYVFNGVGGGWTLGSAFTTSVSVQVLAGTFTTNNLNMTVGVNFISTGALVRTLNLGSSAISCSIWNCLNATNLTMNAGTSTITVTATAGAFNGGGLTYYNLYKASNGFGIADANNTFNAVTNNTVTASGTFACAFAGNQTIGTLTINGGSNATQRVSIQTTITLVGTQITLTVGTFVTNGYVDFRDINFQGAASPITVSTGGDCGNNSNITLAAPKTAYWNLVAGGNWATSTAWALTSGGTPALANYPLPQDTVIIENTGLTSGNTITLNASPNMGSISFSTRTLPMTFAVVATAPVIYGDLTLSSAVTTTATTSVWTFSGFNKTQTITSAGTTVPFGITVLGRLTTVALSGALTSTATTTLTQGTLNLADNNLTCSTFNTNNSNTRTIAFGTGQINLTGNNTTIWNINVATNLTITGGAIVNATYSGATGTRTFLGSAVLGATANINVTAGTDIIVMANYIVNSVNFTGFTGSITTAVGAGGNMTLGAGMTITSSSSWSMFGTSGTQLFTSNGVTLDAPMSFIGVGGTYQLQDNLTLGSTRALTLNAGTLNLNAKTISTGTFAVTGASVRSIAFNGGTITVSGATFTASGSNVTTTGSGVINMTSASSKTFAGGGFSYPTLNQGGAGALVITGANTFRTIANTVAPSTITLPASTTTSIAGFDLVGSAGNLVTLNSSTAGTQATLNNTTGGRIGGDYLSYQDTNATPASTISAGANSTSVSNNTGWLTTPVVFGATAESYTVTETETSQAGFASLNAESLTLTDAQTSQAVFRPTNAETLTLTDAQSTQVAFVITNSESLTLTNTQAGAWNTSSTTAESVTLADSQAGIRGQFGSVADATTLTNTQAAQAVFRPTRAESVTLTDTRTVISQLVGNNAETIVLTDTQIQRGWIKINNSQTPNWTSIDDSQG